MTYKKRAGLFVFGGTCYGLLEILWRGKTHWSMLITGGACFLALFKLFEKIGEIPVKLKCVAGGAVITGFEFVSGCIFNRLLKLDVWDYSENRLNIKGQICAFYSFLWTLLSFPISIICKKMRRS